MFSLGAKKQKVDVGLTPLVAPPRLSQRTQTFSPFPPEACDAAPVVPELISPPPPSALGANSSAASLHALSQESRDVLIIGMRGDPVDSTNEILINLLPHLRFVPQFDFPTIDFATIILKEKVLSISFNPLTAAEFLFERLLDTAPLLNYIASRCGWEGELAISFGDTGHPGHISFSSRRDGMLIPDCFYLRSEAYAAMRAQFSVKAPWSDRSSTVLWRGSTTGVGAVHWSDLARAKLCVAAKNAPAGMSLDVGFTHVVQARSLTEEQEIKDANLMRPWVPSNEFSAYKYHLDIDGNTNSWSGLFLKLLSGGIVLKVESAAGDRQWYYRRLQPWLHYIPVDASLSDLYARIDWAMQNDDRSRQIAEMGRKLAESMTLVAEADFAVAVVDQALACSAQARAARR